MRTAWRRWAPLVVIVAGVVAGAASPAAAVEFDKKSWEVGGYIAHTTYDNDSTISDTFGWGVRGAFIGAPRHEVEFTFGMESADDATRGSGVTYDITRWTIDYVHNLKVKKPESKLAPLLILGAGTMSYDGSGINQLGNPVTGSDSTTVIEGGGGVRIFFTKKFAMRIDGKIWHYHGDGTIIPRDAWYAFDVDLGVSYVFGGGA